MSDSAFLDFLKSMRGSSDDFKRSGSLSTTASLSTTTHTPVGSKSPEITQGIKRPASETLENNDEGLKKVKTNISEDNDEGFKKVKTSISEVSKISTFGEAKFDKEPSYVGFLDIQRLEYAAKLVQKNVGLIIKSAPDYYELIKLINSSNIDSTTRNELKSSDLMALACKIKSKYKLGEVPILDQIYENDIKITKEDQIKLSKLESENPKPLQYEIPKKEIDEISITGIDNDLPPLPKINDISLFEKVFVHKSGVNNRTYLGAEAMIQAHNERLEFLGDSILNNLVTLTIYRTFPLCNEGQLSKIRSDLVNNNMLKKLAFQYGFDKKLRTNFAVDSTKPADQKMYADVFEAYVGALAIERGSDLKEVQEWLEQLYAPTLTQLKNQYLKPPVDRDAKSQLYAIIGRADLRPTYEIVTAGDGITTNFVVDCKMGFEFLGRGIASSSKDASLGAATNALKNTKVLEKYALQRLEIEKPVRIQRKERNEQKRLEKLKKLEEEEKASLNSEEEEPFIPDSPIHTDLFPIEIKDNIELNVEAKNKLYALIGTKTGTKPEYIVSQNEFGKFTVNLKIRNLLVGTAIDSSKKKAMSKVANALLMNDEAIHELCKRF
ncbi:uncharacterized protein KGF55_001195 [Candida pseudojiufengensis]|uniref:uncharacterized protein n=1 Tax=Candida pseudojiufengensis TaxID=497109 RepID=UPI002225910B|nr:uncharacterized protein KGF55_001195 [Candida pseudojiufengensis]KAI5965832.1 hypothetical protein KGF55_001195 [Candida pseudojiufengensis]